MKYHSLATLPHAPANELHRDTKDTSGIGNLWDPRVEVFLGPSEDLGFLKLSPSVYFPCFGYQVL